MPPAAAGSIDQSELALMREISREPIQTQRDLSRGTGLSLGMTNLLLKRLARKGLIKIRQLDWKRTQYLLTPKGALEKSRKTFDYARYTVRLFRQIQDNVASVLRREYDAGRRDFWIVAQDEFESVLKDALAGLHLPGARISVFTAFDQVPRRADLLLTATQETPPSSHQFPQLSLVDFLDASRRLE